MFYGRRAPVGLKKFNRDFYYRENKDSPLAGPMSYAHTLHGAQHLSLNKHHSGLAEVVTILGTRQVILL